MMTDQQMERQRQLAAVRSRGEVSRQAIQRARLHVGSAGLDQAAALEGIVAVGREQAAVREAIKGMLASLQDAVPVAGDGLPEVLAAGREHLDLATQLKALVEDALAQVMAVPTEHVSAEALQEIQRDTLAQIEALEGVLAGVQARTDNPQAEAALEDLRGSVREAAEGVERAAETGQAVALVRAARQALAGLAACTDTSDDQRVAALEELAEHARQLAAQLSREEP